MFKGIASIVCAGLVATSAATSQAAQPQWDERAFNPAPAEGDFILPMPCGGFMALRRIDVASSGYLADQRIQVGIRQDNVAFKEDARFDFIAGSFETGGGSSARHYYLAKYELTELQLAAIRGDCQTPRTRLNVPATGLSWFDAIEVTRLYNEWLLSEASAELPREGDVSSFVRLPTEAEWEFAARGGQSVDEADFSARHFPMPDGQFSEYAWFQGSQSAAGRLRPVGLLQPNPLGLHDVLGNVSEITMDLFRLNRRGRLHGQAGGYVTRGGDISTPQSQMRTALRNENQFFDERTGRAHVVPNTGVRLLLTLPVIVSQERLTHIQEEWRALPAPDLDSASADSQRDALAQLAAVSEETQDRDFQRRLEAAVSELERTRTEQNDIRDRAVLALLQSGAIIGNKIKGDPLWLARTEAVLEEVAGNRDRADQLLSQAQAQGQASDVNRVRQVIARLEAQIEHLTEQIETLYGDVQSTRASYSDLVFGVSSDYSPGIIAAQLEVLVSDYESKGFDYLIPYAQTFVSHIESYRSSGHLARDRWAQELIELGGSNDQ